MDNNEFEYDLISAESEEKITEEEQHELLFGEAAEKPKSHIRESKWLTKEKIRLYIFAAAALLIVIAVLLVSLYIKSDKVDKALDSEQYNRVQIAISQSVTYLETESEEVSGTEEDEALGEDIYYGDGNYYYDENGNLVTEETEESTDDSSSSYDLGVVKIDGDIIYEKSDYGENYRYTRDGERFVTYYYEDFLESIMKEEGEEIDGEWIEVYESNYGSIASFDFSVMDNYAESDFKKVEDYYAPKGNAEEMFFDFLQINQVEKYSNQDMKFYFENGKVSKIVASYTYSDSMDIVQTYKFTYDDEKLTVPDADKRYDASGNLIEGEADEE